MPTEKAKEAEKILSREKLVIVSSRIKEIDYSVIFTPKDIGQATIGVPITKKQEVANAEIGEDAREGEELKDGN